jgi:Putative DNA-binding domain
MMAEYWQYLHHMTKSVDLDTLRALLERAAEAPDLDYKSTWDPDERGEVLEVAKDVAAMESLPTGGYIVVGADDGGQPSGRFTPSDRSKYDDQRVRSKFASALGEPLDLVAALHEVEGNSFLVIGVDRHPDGFRIMARDAQYGQTTVWREGDVFVRRGTSSTRWNQHEARAIVEQVIAERKESWRADIFETVRVNAPAIDSSGYVNVNAEMPLSNFVGAVTELIRRSDLVGLDLLRRRVTSDGIRVVEAAISSGSDSSASFIALSEQLDRLDVVSALTARYDLLDQFAKCVDDYQSIYGRIDEPFMYQTPRRFAEGHLAILVHMYSVGSVLVAERKWSQIAELARLAPLHTGNGYWRSLLRKAEVMTARAELLQDDDGQRILLIERAKATASRLLNIVNEQSSEDATDLLVQFDVYRGIAVAREEGGRLGAYTNFAFYSSSRGEPAFNTVLTDQSARSALFSGNETQLRHLFRQMNQVAAEQSFAYNGWDGFQSLPLLTFTDESAGV